MKRRIVAFVPARGGSTRVPNKNIKKLGGRPLISYAIAEGLKSKLVDRVIVSTDSPKIAGIAKKWGAEVPFLRPPELAQTGTLMAPVIEHAVKYLEEKEHYEVDLVVILLPTSPLRTAGDIDAAIKKIIETKANSCATVCRIGERPEWMYAFRGEMLKPFMSEVPFEKRHAPGQTLPKIFKLNGAVSVTKKDVLMKIHKVIDESSLSAVVMPRERSVDIDEPFDFKMAELLIKEKHYEKNIKNCK